ncbi:MAG: HD domain-containing protein [Candidatus Eremiobacteraeota bacterium]|nr:HD domain-containing protein [Candidatus Eremiobacteraeota bacterium]
MTSADDGRRELEMLHVLGTLAGYHDNDGRYHGARIAEYAELIAARIGLDRSTQRLLALASPLHDIGKIAIPDRILLKPGKLSADEFSIVKTHCEVGYEILSSATSPLMQTAAEIARSHHECWDGSGYPQGIRGESIPFSARIVAVADVFEALVSARPYKVGWPLPQAFDAIHRGRDSQFDPRVVDAFLSSPLQIQDIRQRHVAVSAA